MKKLSYIVLVIFLLCGSSSDIYALEKCQICHSKKEIHRSEETGRKIPLYVDESIIARSVHNDKDCTDCHSDINEIPHKAVKKVNCRRCHYSGNQAGAPDGQMYDQYEHSVHGMAVLAGNEKAPVCQDCHGGHDVFSHKTIESKFYWQNIPKTCGSCHIEIYAIYKESTHGRAVAAGIKDAPTCTSCHGEHDIKPHDNAESRVSDSRISETCTECHGPQGVVNKYNVKTDRVETFEESFHGIGQQMGSKTVANCASCHDYHDIRSEDDPKSSVYPDNIPKTCGKKGCHPGASAEFTLGQQIHINPKSEDSGIIYYISKAFLILTVSVLLGLFAFIIMDLFRRAKNARRKR